MEVHVTPCPLALSSVLSRQELEKSNSWWHRGNSSSSLPNFEFYRKMEALFSRERMLHSCLGWVGSLRIEKITWTSQLHNLIGHNSFFQEALCLVRVLLGSGKPCRLRSGHRKEKNIWRVEANIFYNLAKLSPRRTVYRINTQVHLVLPLVEAGER